MQSKIISFTVLLALVLTTSCVQETHVKEIHFQVDTGSDESIGAVGIRGSLPPLSWNETIELSDPDGDGIFTGKVLVDTGHSSMSFKFVAEDGSYELANQNNRNLEFEYQPQVIRYSTIWNNPEATVVVE
ncbi:hypothetical protein SAMN04490243_1955 [Robiginitalea myxolifaciens]|uniref:Uncharacterized protein n=1 Tax=Robiginitalea myxolifaciens TaxID=400055 RepID=A0A1I6GZR6_9FLAO|nr:hypothetical protein [Robiginitalea myxolifaciens]SFR47675.1 hypothetical protein SAMN04490243_1955 [Robiginitalea myxolifaciens]